MCAQGDVVLVLGGTVRDETERKSMTNLQTRVQTLLDQFVERDVERGLQVAAYLNGELVVDAWAGIADPATGRPVDGETLFTVWSAGKGVAATVIYLLADRGLVAYDAPIPTTGPSLPPTASRRSPSARR